MSLLISTTSFCLHFLLFFFLFIRTPTLSSFPSPLFFFFFFLNNPPPPETTPLPLPAALPISRGARDRAGPRIPRSPRCPPASRGRSRAPPRPPGPPRCPPERVRLPPVAAGRTRRSVPRRQIGRAHV